MFLLGSIVDGFVGVQELRKNYKKLKKTNNNNNDGEGWRLTFLGVKAWNGRLGESLPFNFTVYAFSFYGVTTIHSSFLSMEVLRPLIYGVTRPILSYKMLQISFLGYRLSMECGWIAER